MRDERHDHTEPAAPRAIPAPHSVLRAFQVLVAQSFQRHWRVRQMGWVSAGLLGLVVVWVVIVTVRPAGWGLPDRPLRRGLTHRQYADQLDQVRALPLGLGGHGVVLIGVGPFQATVRPVDDPEDPRRVVFRFSNFLNAWSFMNYSRWVMLGAFLGFVLPLFTLAYASAAFGTERESRSLVWLMTRPIPRSLIYLAKFLGTLPWCVAFALGGFVALGLAGGELGRRALELYWPAAVAATVAFAALFHLVGAVFRRPVVVGLVYVFFFEALVAALPGSLKLLSLSYYARCLMYNAAEAAGYPTDMLDVTDPVSPVTAWAFLTVVTTGLTALGMWLFARSEYRDDI